MYYVWKWETENFVIIYWPHAIPNLNFLLLHITQNKIFWNMSCFCTYKITGNGCWTPILIKILYFILCSAEEINTEIQVNHIFSFRFQTSSNFPSFCQPVKVKDSYFTTLLKLHTASSYITQAGVNMCVCPFVYMCVVYVYLTHSNQIKQTQQECEPFLK